MSKNVINTELKVNQTATPEQIGEYQKLKARNEWIKMNQQRLDEIEAKRLRLGRWLLVISILNLFINLTVLVL